MRQNEPRCVIFHCTDSPDYRADNPLFNSVNAKVVDEWHKARGWTKIGYHWLILRDGTIERGRDEIEIGAHCVGHNFRSVGVCWVGTEEPTIHQMYALKLLYEDIFQRRSITWDHWFPHNAFNSGKRCPVLSMKDVGEWILTGVLSGSLSAKVQIESLQKMS